MLTVKEKIQMILKKVIDDNDGEVYISSKIYSDLETLVEENRKPCGCDFELF